MPGSMDGKPIDAARPCPKKTKWLRAGLFERVAPLIVVNLNCSAY